MKMIAKAVLLLVVGLRVAAADEPAAPVPQPLGADVWLLPGGFDPPRQPDGNTIVFRGSTGLVVLDTGRHRWQRTAIMDLARAQMQPVVAIVNSHWHLDHVSGNAELKSAFPMAKVYASDAIDDALSGFFPESAKSSREYLQTPGVPAALAEDIRADLETIANGDRLRPDVIVSASEVLNLGGRTLEVHLAHDGPTARDLWIYDPTSRIEAAGDLVTLPVPFFDTACASGWQSAMAELESRPFEILVPGHGKPMTGDEFRLYRGAFDAFVDCARSSAPADECGARWVQAASSLLAANAMDPGGAQAMAAYYVEQVLRPNGGNSKWCRASLIDDRNKTQR